MFRYALFLTLIVAFSANAQEEDCYETAMTQSEINRCAGQKNQEIQDLLDALLLELTETLPDEPEAHLVESQKAWATVVENDCEIQSWYVEGGSARPMVVASCYAAHSYQRIKMLLPLLCHPMFSVCEARTKYEQNL